MNTSKQSIAITEAMGIPQPLSTTRQSTRSRRGQQEKLTYFSICIYDLSEQSRPKIVKELQAGKKYTLAITCEIAPSSINKKLTQQGKSINEPFSLLLSYSYSRSIVSPLILLPDERSFDKIFADEAEHDLILPTDLPSGNLSISLSVKTSLRKYPSEVTHYTIPVSGEHNIHLLDILTVSQINQRLPEKTAILLVEMETSPTARGQHLHLRGWAEAGQQLDGVETSNVIVSIEKLREYRQQQHKSNLAPEQILNRLRNFSRKSSLPFLSWLDKLFGDYQEPFNLIIVDLTDREIPWELLEFKAGLYLGASARVVRWLPTHHFLDRPILSIEPNHHEGPVISYLDEGLGSEKIQHERSALQRLMGRPYASLSDLQQRLTDSLEDVGLIYIGCHGTKGRELVELQQFVPELSSIMLEGTYHCQSPRLTVFMNACEGARTINMTLDDKSNFVDVFLAHCASGFIGPLAQVDIQTASLIGKQLLLAALQPGGVQIAEMLRLLRENEIMHLEDLKKSKSATKEDYYRVLDTFMYVYYGNPLAYLQLYPRKEAGQ